jgi:Plant ATP synthase F0
MLCRTNALHLRPQLDQFTYLTQFIRFCLVHITPHFVLHSVWVFTNTEWPPCILLRKRLVQQGKVGA